MVCGSGGSKSRLAKAAGAEPDERWKIARRCGAKHISKLKCTKHTSGPDHFWKLRCRKSARRCGAKHISKSKCTKHTMFGPLLEVEMSKKCTPLWREAHFEVKMYKTHQVRTTFGSWDVEKVHAVVVRSTFRSQNVKNTRVRTTFGRSDVVSRGRRKGLCPLSEVSKTCRFCSISNYNHHYTTLQYTTLQLHLHYIPLHYTPLHCTTLHYTPLHYTQLHYTTLHYTTLHYTAFHYTPLHYTQLHYATLHYTIPTTTTTTQLQQYYIYTTLH